MEADASAVLSQLPPGLRREFRLSGPDLAVARLLSVANTVVRVTTPRGDLVVRISSPRDPVYVAAERAALHRASALGLGPEVVWFGADGALLVTRTIRGRTLAARDIRIPSTAAAIGAALRRFHDGKVALPTEDLGHLLARLDTFSAKFQVPPVSSRLRSAVTTAAAHRVEPVASHGDPHAANWLQCDDGLRLVDWEYARLHEPAWDLATVALDIGAGDPAVDALLGGYGADDHVRLRLWPAALLVLVVDGLWSMAQLGDVARGRSRLEAAEALARQLA